MYRLLNMLKLKDIFELCILKFIQSFLYGPNYNIFETYFVSLLPNHSYNTRGNRQNYPANRLKLERSMTIYKCVQIFNDAPEQIGLN